MQAGNNKRVAIDLVDTNGKTIETLHDFGYTYDTEVQYKMVKGGHISIRLYSNNHLPQEAWVRFSKSDY